MQLLAYTMPFARLCGKTLQADVDGGTVTSDGGVLLLRETESHVGIMRRFVAALDDHHDVRYTDHSYLGKLSDMPRFLVATR